MPIEYVIYPEQQLVVERFHGRITAAEIEQVTKEVWAEEAYDRSFDGVIDMTGAELDITRPDILALGELLFSAPMASKGRIAIIVDQPVETALSFVFQSDMALKNEIAVFSTWASVRNFLDLPAEMANQLDRKPK